MKKAIIYYEKAWTANDKPAIRLLGWKNVKRKDELPIEYLQGEPYFFYDPEAPFLLETCPMLIIRYGGHPEMTFCRKSLIGKKDWEEFVEVMKQAGKRLHEIMKKKKWSGKGEIVI